MSGTAADVVRAAQMAISHGGHWLKELPLDILNIGRKQLWREIKPRNRDAFRDFCDFCQHQLPDGLGCDIDRLIRLCDTNSEAQLWLRSELAGTQAVTVKQGGDQRSKNIKVDNINIDRGGTGAEYLLRRLAKTEPAIVKRYESGEFPSVRAAAIEAGIIKIPSAVDVAVKAYLKLSTADRSKFANRIKHAHTNR
jgi:hypothetical protein